MAITLTEKAVQAVKRTMENQGLSPDATYLRVGVAGGGCSGFNYSLAFASTRDDRDELFDCDGIRVLCDPKGYVYLKDTQIDYRDGIMEQGFAFENPNAASSCGCGKSFCV